ncbi:hypothetical protein ABE10_03255, partial [Bacillus toyonensis]|nr:hypothetical protein [Bacillus toyonensis]
RAVRSDERAEHVLQDAAVAVVVGLAGGVDADDRVELDRLLALRRELARRRRDLDRLRRDSLVQLLKPLDRDDLGAVEAQRLPGLADGELQRHDAHADEVRAVDAFEALGDDRLHPEEVRALGRPVARRAGAVLLAAEDHQRGALRLVVLRGVVDVGLRSAGLGEVPREAALDLLAAVDRLDEGVLQPDVRERAADHDLVVPATRAVGVEILLRHAVLGEVLRGGGARLDVAGRGDVVGRDRVTQRGQHSGTGDVADRRRCETHAVEVGGLPHVGRVRVPLEDGAGRCWQVLPPLVSVEDRRILLDELVARDRGVDDLLHLGRVRPDVLEEDVLSGRVLAQRVVLEVEVHRAGQRVCHHQRRAGEVVHLHVGADASLEVPVAGQDGGDREVVLVDRGRDLVDQRPGVADADRAPVSDRVEAEAFEILVETGLLVVVGDDLGAGAERRLDPRLLLQALLTRLAGEKTRGDHDGGVRGVGARGDGRQRHRAVVEDVPLPLWRGHSDRRGGVRRSAAVDVHRTGRRLLLSGDGAGIGCREGVLRLEVDDVVRRRCRGVVQDVLLELRLGLRQEDAVLRALRPCDRGDDRGEVELEVLAVLRLVRRIVPERLLLRVLLHESDSLLVATGETQVVERHIVDREDRGGRAELRRHVPDGGAVGQRHRGHAGTVELDELAHHAVLAQHVGDREDDVGRGHARGDLAGQLEADDARDQHRHGLPEHRRLRLDPADAPA